MGKFYFKNIKYILRTLIKKARTEAGQKEIRMNFDEKLKNSKGIDGIIKKLKVMRSKPRKEIPRKFRERIRKKPSS